MESTQQVIMEMPAVALRGLTIMPDMIIHFDLSRKKSVLAVEQAMLKDQRLFLVAQRNTDEEDPDAEALYKVGTIAVVKQVSKLPNGIVRVLVAGQDRGRLLFLEENTPEYLLAQVELIPKCDGELEPATEEAILRSSKELFQAYVQYNPESWDGHWSGNCKI